MVLIKQAFSISMVSQYMYNPKGWILIVPWPPMPLLYLLQTPCQNSIQCHSDKIICDFLVPELRPTLMSCDVGAELQQNSGVLYTWNQLSSLETWLRISLAVWIYLYSVLKTATTMDKDMERVIPLNIKKRVEKILVNSVSLLETLSYVSHFIWSMYI